MLNKHLSPLCHLASSVTYFEAESKSLVDLELLLLSLGDFELDPSVSTLQVLKLQVYAFLPGLCGAGNQTQCFLRASKYSTN